jgi:hypothetical protein
LADITEIKPIPLKTALMGLAFAAIVAFWGQYASAQMNYNYLTFPQMPLCLLIPFVFFVLTPNLLIRHFYPQIALTKADLLTIFSMGLIAATVPDWGMVRYLISLITAPNYFASTENQWAERFFEYLPQWTVLPNDKFQVADFYAGLASDAFIPWRDWIIPLFWWLSALCTLLFSGACIVVILRKQWVEHERLRFPMGEVIVRLLASEDESSGRWPALLTNRLFQTGFLISLGIMIWNVISFWGALPHIPFPGPAFNLVIDPAYPPMVIRLVPYALCFSFFINVEILFSVWFFQIVGILETGILNSLGVVAPVSTIVPRGLVSIQFSGGLIMFVLIGLWMARSHLKMVCQHAIGRKNELNDEDELFSYRTAVFGLIAGLIYLTAWLHAIGLTWPIAILFLFFLFVFYIGIARVLAEAGLINLDLPINAHAFTIGVVGSANMTGSTLTGLGLTNAFARNWRTFTMVGWSHVAWFRDYLGANRRHLFLLVSLAFLVSTLSSIWYVIYSGYSQGADNLHINLTNTGNLFFNLIVNWMKNATQITAVEITFLLSGMIINLILTVGRYLFYWWPLNPIGFAIGASGTIRGNTFTFFTAWLIQIILLRLGGVHLYKKAQPLFLGILVGYIVGVALAYSVDTVYFPDQPHMGNIF